MPRVTYTAEGFPVPFASINGMHDLDLSWPFLVWSAISVGRAKLIHIFRYGEFSMFESVYRAAIIFANLCDDGNERFKRSEAYEGLDPSEKGAISYFLGLAIAKAFAERILEVPWLMHLDVYWQELQPNIVGRTRPDLVGQTTTGGWVVIEAKGRTKAFAPAALQKAKQQAQRLATVSGQDPVLRIGMLTHFGSKGLQFAARDPEFDEEGERIDLPLSQQKLIEAYYRPFRTWLSEDPRTSEIEIAGKRYRAVSIENVGLTVGLEINLFEEKVTTRPAINHQLAQDEKYFAGRDGILVVLGPVWSRENMLLEPQERRSTV